MVAAWALKKFGAEDYDITIYTLGWRPGGKCATGRDASMEQRVYEHGYHCIGGYYENFFRVMRDCIGDDLESEFVRLNELTFDLKLGDKIVKWKVDLGDGIGGMEWLGRFDGERPEPTPRELQRRLYRLLARASERAFTELHPYCCKTATTSYRRLGGKLPGVHTQRLADDALHVPARTQDEEGWALDEKGRYAPRGEPDDWAGYLLSTCAYELRAMQRLAEDEIGDEELYWATRELRSRVAQRAKKLTKVVDTYRLHKSFKDAPHREQDEAAKKGIGFAIRLGMRLDELMNDVRVGHAYKSGFDVLDAWDYREVLRRLNVEDEVIESGIVRAAYEYPFSNHFSVGDSGAGMSVAVALRFMMRMMLDFAGGFQWHPRKGMGDSAIKPLYDKLLAQGVKFRFFRRIDSLVLTEDGRRIEAVELAKQIPIDDDAFDPLVDGSWPERHPDLEGMSDEELFRLESNVELPNEEKYRLEAQRDFDSVICAIPLGDMARVGERMLERVSPRMAREWEGMFARVKRIGTWGVQLFFDAPPEQFYSPHWGPLNVGELSAPFLASWADCSHQLDWDDSKAGTMIMLVGRKPAAWSTLDDVKNATRAWIDTATPHEWSAALLEDGSVNEDAFYGSFDTQYFRINSVGEGRDWELYNQAPPYATNYRVSANGRSGPRWRSKEGVDNLFFAGDWVRTGLNAGAVEAAVMSGMNAANQVMGEERVPIYGFEDYPASPPPDARQR